MHACRCVRLHTDTQAVLLKAGYIAKQAQRGRDVSKEMLQTVEGNTKLHAVSPSAILETALS